MVGAVLVVDNQIVSEGWHRRHGGPHAESAALKDIPPEVGCQGTLYVNLEPCCFTGKTPPCTELIIKKRIPRVIVGMADPNSLVNGKGLQILRNQGIEITTGILENECRELNRSYCKYITTGLPEIILKTAATLDGRIGTKTTDSRWITGIRARTFTHKMRAEIDAVMVGIGTVLADDPQLTVRHVKGRNPVRVIIDTNLRTPIGSKVLNSGDKTKTYIFAGEKLDRSKIDLYSGSNCEVIQVGLDEQGHVDLEQVFKHLGGLGIASVMVEGGGTVFSGILKRRLADKIVAVIAPKIIGGDGIPLFKEIGIEKMSEVDTFMFNKIRRLGDDLMIEIVLKEHCH